MSDPIVTNKLVPTKLIAPVCMMIVRLPSLAQWTPIFSR